MFTVGDLRKRYAVSEMTVLQWIKLGEIQAFNVNRTPGAKKARWRITQAAVEAFEKSRTLTAAKSA